MKALGVTQSWQCVDNGGPVADALVNDIYAPGDKPIANLLRYARDGAFKMLFYTGNFDRLGGSYSKSV